MVHYKTSHLKVLEFSWKFALQPAKLLFGFPHYRAKKKVVVNFIYGYQTLSGEKCKSNGKRISSFRHTSEEKNPKTIRKYHISGKWYFRMVFWIFLFTGMSDWANSFYIALVFFSWTQFWILGSQCHSHRALLYMYQRIVSPHENMDRTRLYPQIVTLH